MIEMLFMAYGQTFKMVAKDVKTARLIWDQTVRATTFTPVTERP
jgi:hypothetical protein